MKILCTADIHIGHQVYGKIDPITGLNTRTLHSLNVLDYMIDYAINHNVEVFVFAGDMYKNNLPTPTIQNEVNKRIKKLSDNNIHSFILDGNHDVSKLENSKSAMKSFSTFKIDNIIHDKFLNKSIYQSIDGKTYQFIMLPTYANKEELINIIEKIDYTYPTIFIGHLTMKGALLNDWLIEDKEEYIDIDIFNKENVKAVILGHLHKHQILSNKPLIFYTGSPDRIDFGEEKQIKGFTILEINDIINYEFIENNAEKFCTIKINIKNIEDYQNAIITNIDLSSDKIKDAITRVIIDLDLEQIIDEKQIYNEINKFSPKFIVNIQKNYNAKKHQRNTEITNELSMDKNIELYFKDKKREKERIKLAKSIYKEITE